MGRWSGLGLGFGRAEGPGVSSEEIPRLRGRQSGEWDNGAGVRGQRGGRDCMGGGGHPASLGPHTQEVAHRSLGPGPAPTPSAAHSVQQGAVTHRGRARGHLQEAWLGLLPLTSPGPSGGATPRLRGSRWAALGPLLPTTCPQPHQLTDLWSYHWVQLGQQPPSLGRAAASPRQCPGPWPSSKVGPPL